MEIARRNLTKNSRSITKKCVFLNLPFAFVPSSHSIRPLLRSQMVKVCPECGSTSLETVLEEAQTYCGDCGVVVERGAIVTEVTFTETNGQANVVGQFVSGESGTYLDPIIYIYVKIGGARTALG